MVGQADLSTCIQATWTQVTIFFPLGVRSGSKKKKKKKKKKETTNLKYVRDCMVNKLFQHPPQLGTVGNKCLHGHSVYIMPL